MHITGTPVCMRTQNKYCVLWSNETKRFCALPPTTKSFLYHQLLVVVSCTSNIQQHPVSRLGNTTKNYTLLLFWNPLLAFQKCSFAVGRRPWHARFVCPRVNKKPTWIKHNAILDKVHIYHMKTMHRWLKRTHVVVRVEVLNRMVSNTFIWSLTFKLYSHVV